jgi:hypothetical protein
MLAIGLTGMLNKPIMDKLGFKKLSRGYYRNCIIIGIFLLLFTLLYNIL